MRQVTAFKGKVLAQLLGQDHEDEFWESAFRTVLERQQPDVQHAFQAFFSIAERHTQQEIAPHSPGAGPRYRLSSGARSRTFRQGTIKGRILQRLANMEDFTKVEFRNAVIEVMQWDPKTEIFGVQTRFVSLEAASQAWLATLRKEKLVSEAE